MGTEFILTFHRQGLRLLYVELSNEFYTIFCVTMCVMGKRYIEADRVIGTHVIVSSQQSFTMPKPNSVHYLYFKENKLYVVVWED